MMKRKQADSFSFHKIDTRFPILIYKNKIIIDYKPVWSVYHLITRKDSLKPDKSQIIYYTATDNNSKHCTILFYKDEDPEYYRVDYIDSFKVYYVMEK